MQIEHQIRDGRVDFDFFMGNWTGHNRRLRARLKGSTDWEEFEGTVSAHKILGGLGNFDEVTFNRASGQIQGATLRLFDVETQLWRIYWAGGAQGTLDVPMIGVFNNGRGEFYAQELLKESPSSAALSGLFSAKTPVVGSRHFLPMAGGPGKPTGRAISPECPKHSRIADFVPCPYNGQQGIMPLVQDKIGEERNVPSNDTSAGSAGLVTIAWSHDGRGHGAAIGSQYPNVTPLHYHASGPGHPDHRGAGPPWQL